MTRVETDDDPARRVSASCAQNVGQTVTGLTDHGGVHRVRTSADRAAQPGGAKAEAPGKTLGQEGFITPLKGSLKLCSINRIRVSIDPSLHPSP